VPLRRGRPKFTRSRPHASGSSSRIVGNRSGERLRANCLRVGPRAQLLDVLEQTPAQILAARGDPESLSCTVTGSVWTGQISAERSVIWQND